MIADTHSLYLWLRQMLCLWQRKLNPSSVCLLQLEAARQYHVKVMGWVLDWEHVTPLVEPYWSPEKAYLVLPLKEERPPKKATDEPARVLTGDSPAEGPGGNKGTQETGVIDCVIPTELVITVVVPATSCPAAVAILNSGWSIARVKVAPTSSTLVRCALRGGQIAVKPIVGRVTVMVEAGPRLPLRS